MSCCFLNESGNLRMDDPNGLLRLYFEDGYSYQLILLFLAYLHGVCMSMRTLKRRLHKMGLKRRGSSQNQTFIVAIVYNRLKSIRIMYLWRILALER